MAARPGRPIILGLMFLIGAGALRGAGAAEHKKKRRAKHHQAAIAAKADVSAAYDDNVHEYSPRDIDTFNGLNAGSSAKNTAKFDRVKSIGDAILRFKGELSGGGSVFGSGFATRLGAEGGYAQYSKNSIMSHPSVRFFLRQDLTGRHRLEITYDYQPGKFLKNYLGEISTATRFAGLHDTRAWALRWSGRFSDIPGLQLGAHAGYETDHYRESELEYRNSVARRFGADGGYRWTEELKTDVEYQYEALSAARGPASDISYVEHKLGLKAETKPMPKLDVDFGYVAHFKSYSSALGAADVFHAGRRDVRHDVMFKALYHLSRSVELWAEYKRIQESSNLRDAVTTTVAPDEFLRYRRNIVSVGVKARWN